MLNCMQSKENSGGAAAPQPTPQIGPCLDLQMGLAVGGKWTMGSTTHSNRKKSANLVSTTVQPEPTTPAFKH